MAEKINVLLVDDEVDFINMMQFWLKNREFNADVLYGAEGVLEKIKDETYNIMFLDLNLPGMSGIELLKKIRQVNNKIPVIIFSAFGTKETLKEAYALGISGFFGKERGFEEAARLIHTALRIHKGLSQKHEDKGEK